MTTYLQKTGHFVISADDGPVCLDFDFLPFILVIRYIPSGQTRFTLSILQEYKSNLNIWEMCKNSRLRLRNCIEIEAYHVWPWLVVFEGENGNLNLRL